MVVIYGVDTDKPFSTVQVRDAMITCFVEAHQEDAEKKDAVPKDQAVAHCKEVVQKGFMEIGGDFNNPTKPALQKVVFFLAAYSASFRNPEIIERHKNQMLSLVQRLP